MPKYLVPDNLKTAITKHTKDELVINSVYQDLENFYDVVILPPPPRKPKGKPTVEKYVQFLETHLLEDLKEKFTTVSKISIVMYGKNSGHQQREKDLPVPFQNGKFPSI